MGKATEVIDAMVKMGYQREDLSYITDDLLERYQTAPEFAISGKQTVYGTKFSIEDGNWFWMSGKDNTLDTVCKMESPHQIRPSAKSTHSSVPGKFCHEGIERYNVEKIDLVT